MKHAKKLVSIPESEYNALLGLLTGNDPIKKEMLLTDQKIEEIFKKPNLTPLERGARYQSLSRKRRMLNKQIEDKPIRVLMDQSKASVLPTAGIAPVTKPTVKIQEVQQQQKQQPDIKEEEPEPEEEEEVVAEPKALLDDIFAKYHSVIDDQFSNELYNYVNGNREQLGITEDGKIITNMQKKAYGAQEGSDFKNVLNYLIGRSDSFAERKSTKVLINRLMKKEEIQDLIAQSKKQEGRGRKKYVVDLKATAAIKTSKNKTKGLIRFKPLLWSKIPV
jgi:hypothetical protein